MRHDGHWSGGLRVARMKQRRLFGLISRLTLYIHLPARIHGHVRHREEPLPTLVEALVCHQGKKTLLGGYPVSLGTRYAAKTATRGLIGKQPKERMVSLACEAIPKALKAMTVCAHASGPSELH